MSKAENDLTQLLNRQVSVFQLNDNRLREVLIVALRAMRNTQQR